jgi:peptide/nickel transport system ATP-binding protein
MRSIPASAEPRTSDAVLRIEQLSVTYATEQGEVPAVRDFSLEIAAGECVGIVGESGAGKSQTFLAVMGLLGSRARVRGSARFGDLELLGSDAAVLDRVRGSAMSMIFQDPLTTLTPHLRIGDLIAEPLVRHKGLSWRAARKEALRLLNAVRVNDASRRMKQYPHEISGGMRQRVMIASALACNPRLVIADEPTTALDVTIQAQIIALLAELKRERGMSLVLITHDFGLVAGIADRVVVMSGGRIVEQGPTERVLRSPEQPYTRALLEATPRLAKPSQADESVVPANGEPILELFDVRVQFELRGGLLGRRARVQAVEGVSVWVRAGEALGIVGESGCGKSTLARAILQLIKPVSGRVVWMGRGLQEMARSELRSLRREMQIVFQDPLASLNPRMTVGEIVAEPLLVHSPQLGSAARTQASIEMLEKVGLAPQMLNRFPHQLSGGQAQRVAIARAMIVRPALLICDEPVSALDVSIQAQIVALLRQLMREHRMSILFISHNLAVVQQLCERVLVLYLGRMMELADAASLYAQPLHPYTQALLAAVPVPDPEIQPGRLAEALPGELPSPLSPPSGCVFRTRCTHATGLCAREAPAWEAVGPLRNVACHRWQEPNTANPAAKSLSLPQGGSVD